MRTLFFSFLLSLCSIESFAQYASSSNLQKKEGDYIESTSYNDIKRGRPRMLQYLPDGNDFVCVNGNNRYTRALYGSHTAWRVETSDRPIFATYVKNDSRNISFCLRFPNGNVFHLEETSWCEARYTPGRRSYILKDTAWGKKAFLKMSVLASPTEEKALWKISGKGLPDGCIVEVLNAPIRLKKLSRSGDIGADPPRCFDPSEDGKILQTLKCSLSVKLPLYISVYNNELEEVKDSSVFAEYENARRALAGRIRINTPDPYFNTLGGDLSVAADGIWDGEVWQHGAVGWRMPLCGWRAAYTGDALGWHDRARIHFNAYAASQVTKVPNTIFHPAQDSTLALARAEKKWGTPMYSNGYICRNPHRNDQMHHYDMNLCYIDELLWHFNWTGDLQYARLMWPVITSHLAWEKRNFDPDDDGLYDAYACIWASDALYYNSGAVTHSSAYNYRANRMAALIADKIGENSEPYKKEADKILKAINNRLWLKDKGHWAEYQDFMGHKRLHEDAAVWTVYHAIDSYVADPFQAYLATRYVDKDIPHIPVVTSKDLLKDYSDSSWRQRMEIANAAINAGSYATISTTDWLPYSWSINNVAFAEVMHTALSYFQAGRSETGFKLLKSSVLDGMYMGESPGNFGQLSFYDAARGECYRDFGDPIGVASRVLIQGLYGVLPDALNGRLVMKPGFPKEWKYASLSTPDIDFDFKIESKKSHAVKSFYTVTHHLMAVHDLEIQFPAYRSRIANLTVNGKKVLWKLVENSVKYPHVSVSFHALPGKEYRVCVEWAGEHLINPHDNDNYPVYSVKQIGPVKFVAMKQGDMKWWAPLDILSSEVKDSVSLTNNSVDLGNVETDKCEPVVIDNSLNAKVTDIFRNKYLSPRSPYTTLQIPEQGIGEWCHPLETANIDDSGLRAAVHNNILQTNVGIPFRTPAEGLNIAFTSLWNNYPDSVVIPLKGKASCAYLLMAGSTNHMQSHIENAVVRAYYKDGSYDLLPLVNPDNWAPIEQFFFEDGKAFNRHTSSIYRLRLKTGDVSNHFGEELSYKGVSRIVDGGAATLLRMPLNNNKELSHIVLETLSNEVVIGIMGITLHR